MSADNWALCPRCKARKMAEFDKLRADVLAVYGEVDVAEFDRRRSAVEATIAAFDEDTLFTFREDFEIGINNFVPNRPGVAVVYACYGGSCGQCGLEHTFTRGPIDVYDPATDPELVT